MKDIQKIVMEVDNITKNQLAVDLSEDEKKELEGLIESGSGETLQQSVPYTCCNCDSAIPPSCTPGTFSCLISVPTDFTFVPGDLHAGVSQHTNFTVTQVSGKCTATLSNGCTIALNSAKVTGSVKVFASLGFKDPSGNCAFLCCTDVVCFCNSDVVCYGTIDPNAIKFLVSDLSYQNLGTTRSSYPKINIYEVTGKITPTF
ncbi:MULTISPECIES: hypothetical protein [Clostridium]|uniref:Uncharacterized protein n=2 Tax=Clostridium TaxID=1485 RepID=D8GI83_CLOLD|nr:MULTISPECIES: hypothetical protein [Clostridium]ADK14945.1 hypothetical protein CLJU_c18830 [Clostridium ljungdahlii DSM 13528]OAA87940.1 hypothetical protein WX45_03424 [Clostridium ljungdahlii DSM 13528]OAA94037.1 hypothetical protein WX73_03607 [Clostridium coskatii]OBR96599.1 hypothetical protein CLCOS_07610 [Clostridium coskatii]